MIGVDGVILLPDNWSTSTYSLNQPNTPKATFISNVINTSQWAALENAGAVFLPAAGCRVDTSVYFVGSYGLYWSASSRGRDNAYDVYFTEDYLNAGSWDCRFFGRTVRLVTPAE